MNPADTTPNGDATPASDKRYTQFWWRLIFESAILALLGLYFAFAGN